MYEVYADGNLIHYSGDDECILINPKIKSALNDAGSFEFGISPLHEFYDAIKRRRTIVSVLENGKEIFCGEVREENKSGNLKKQVYCVGELAFLYDSIQPQAEYHDMSPRDLLEVWLDIHNSQMIEESKRFYVGIVTVHDTNDSLYRFTNYESTLDAIKEKLVGKLGGYLKVRKVNGKKYLDWLTIETYGKICEQTVEFGENLLDYSENTTASDIYTALIPLGARVEESEDSGEEDSVPQALEKYVNITSVNGGSDCIKLDDAVREYGFICKVVRWEDVHIPSNLLEKGRQWLIDNQYESMTLKIKAIDMSRYSENYDKWELGDRVRAKADIYGMDRIFPVSEMEIILDSPENNVLILGNTIKTMSGNSNSISGKIQEESEKNYQRTQWLQNAIDNATQMLTGSKGGYKLSEYDENGLWVRDLYMDAPSKDDAQNIIQINMNGIGFSRTGYDGPYLNAWTIDGTFLGEFIKAHSIKAESLETEYIEKVEKQITDAETGAKEYADDKITTKVSALESQITLSVETERKRASEAEEYLLSEVIVTQDRITSEVSRAISAESNLSSRITQNESSISSEVTRAKNAESELTSKITQTANSISSFVTSGDVSSMIEQKADSIRLKASRIAWSSTYSSMTSDGTFTCQKANIQGTITSENGTMGKSSLGGARLQFNPWVENSSGYKWSFLCGTTTGDTTGFLYTSASGAMGVKIVGKDLTSYGTITYKNISGSSDETKKNMAEMTEKHDKLFDLLHAFSFTWKDDDEREHFGLSAQKTKKALIEAGFDANKNGIYYEAKNEEGETELSVGYTEIIPLLIRQVQKLKKKVDGLEHIY